MKRISLVVPCYNEEEVVPSLLARIATLAGQLPAYRLEAVCVNDGSRDRTLDALLEHLPRHPGVELVAVDLSRNFGKEAALSAGLAVARGDAVVPLDADLQDPPELVPRMVALWEEGADVVLAHRSDRDTDHWLKRLSARLFYRLHNHVSDVRIPHDVGDFRLMDRAVVDVVNALPENRRFMKGLFAWAGFRAATIDYSRAPRSSGKSRFDGASLLHLAIEGVTSFSITPLRVASYIGILAGVGEHGPRALRDLVARHRPRRRGLAGVRARGVRPLVGPTMNFGPYLGPVWIWLQAIPLVFMPSHVATSVFIAAVAALKFPLLFWLGRLLSGDRLGLAFVAASAFPSIAVFQWVVFFHPSWVEVSIVFVLLLAALAVKRRSLPLAYACAAAFGFALQMHPTSLFYAPFVALAFYRVGARGARLLGHAVGAAALALAGFAPVLVAGDLGQVERAGGVASRIGASLATFSVQDVFLVLRSAYVEIPRAVGETYAAALGVPIALWNAALAVVGLAAARDFSWRLDGPIPADDPSRCSPACSSRVGWRSPRSEAIRDFISATSCCPFPPSCLERGWNSSRPPGIRHCEPGVSRQSAWRWCVSPLQPLAPGRLAVTPKCSRACRRSAISGIPTSS